MEYCRRLEKASPWIRVTSFGKSPDMLKDYRTRVEGTYSVLEATMKLMNHEYRSLRHAVSDADAGTMAGVERPFPVDYESVDAPNSSTQFLGFKQSNTPSMEPMAREMLQKDSALQTE